MASYASVPEAPLTLESADGQRRISATRRERGLLVAVIVLGFCQWALPGADPDVGTGSPFANVLWGGTYVFAFAGVVAEREAAMRLMRASWPLAAVIALAFLSMTWSAEPALTARRSIELAGSCAIALRFVCRLSLDDFVQTLGATLAVLGAISFVAIAVVPSVGAGDDGAWQGVFDHKNALGAAMTIGIVTVACNAARLPKGRRPLLAATLIMFLLLLVGSKAAGAIVGALIVVLVTAALLATRAKWFSGGIFVILAAIVAIIGTFATLASGLGLEDALGALGKDSTLSGRVDVWRLVFNAIQERPILGYGYGVFWGPDKAAATLVYPGITNHWEPESAHNGFLEVALSLGLVGEVALLFMIFIGLRRALFFFDRTRTPLSIWPLCAMLCSITLNLSEATFAAYGIIDWVVFTAAYLYSTKAYLDNRDWSATAANADVPARVRFGS